MKKAYLILENGDFFEGKVPEGQEENCRGEVVFTTSMTGYCESLTDPSYAGQILVFTYPLIGNYGVSPPEKWESEYIQLEGVVVNESCEKWCHPEGRHSLQEWIRREQKTLLADIDTRALTKVLRTQGSMAGVITTQWNQNITFSQKTFFRTIEKKRILGRGKKRLVVVDCGIKKSMLTFLKQFDVEILQVPYDYDYTGETYDGIFLSNGPADPTFYTTTVAFLKKALRRQKPIFGICLGCQLLALAAGATTYKLPFGHRGQNQPCQDLETKKSYITSQNHGYAIDAKTLPVEWKVSFRNLNDHSVEGIQHTQLPFYGVQFHPEASPGPTDMRWLFKRFYTCL